MPTITGRKLQPKSDLGRRLLRLCEAKGHRSLADAAKATGLHYNQLYRIVTGAKDPRWSTVERIVRTLGGGIGDFPAEPADLGLTPVVRSE